MATRTLFKKHMAHPRGILAVKYDGKNAAELVRELTEEGLKASYSSKTMRVRVDTKEFGIKFLSINDYIVKYDNGDFYVFKNAEFLEHWKA